MNLITYAAVSNDRTTAAITQDTEFNTVLSKSPDGEQIKQRFVDNRCGRQHKLITKSVIVCSEKKTIRT